LDQPSSIAAEMAGSQPPQPHYSNRTTRKLQEVAFDAPAPQTLPQEEKSGHSADRYYPD
jgi:hypothetical protein